MLAKPCKYREEGEGAWVEQARCRACGHEFGDHSAGWYGHCGYGQEARDCKCTAFKSNCLLRLAYNYTGLTKRKYGGNMETKPTATEAVTPPAIDGNYIEQAQHVLETAAAGGYFDTFREAQNNAETHENLRKHANELLAGQYPGLEVKVIVYPGSEYIDLKVEGPEGA